MIGLRKGEERGRYPLCKEEENEPRILLKCKEIKIWREQFLHKKRPQINEETVYRKLVSNTKILELRHWVYFYIQNKVYIVTLTKKIAAEWRRKTVKCTIHGDSILYTTYNNTIR